MMNKAIVPKRVRKIAPPAFMFLALSGLGLAISWWESESSTVRQLPDFASFQDVKMKKKAFFDFLRPIVRSVNHRVKEKRQKMLAIRDKLDRGEALSGSERAWLLQLADEYHVDMAGIDDVRAWKLLKRRVDTVPFRLALAQAANESAWGTSRFARQGLNLFGQWCFTEGCGIVPAKRQSGMTHEVATFDSVNESVASYIRSINRVQMYAPLRKLRQKIKKRGNRPTAIELVQKLSGYSERGEGYVKAIEKMIRKNYGLMSGNFAITENATRVADGK